MSTIATTKLSSKGQVVIPELIRKKLGLEPGTEFVVLGDKDVVVLKTEILAEYAEVAERLTAEFGLGEAETTIALMATGAEIVAAPQLPTQVCDDPDDDKFFACAVAARVPIVISGDKALRRASGYRDIEVLTARQFVDAHQPVADDRLS